MQCESCMYYQYDEEYEEYFCDVNLDEDEMERFLRDGFRNCPYYRRMSTARCVNRCNTKKSQNWRNFLHKFPLPENRKNRILETTEKCGILSEKRK